MPSLPSDPDQGASTLNPSGSGKEQVASVVAKAGVGDDLMKAGLLGGLRAAMVNNYEDRFIPTIDDPHEALWSWSSSRPLSGTGPEITTFNGSKPRTGPCWICRPGRVRTGP